MTTTPLAFLVSLVGVITNSGRAQAIAGLVISGIMGVVFIGIPFILQCLL